MIARLAAADLAVFSLMRTAGHTPSVERAVAAFSKLGEHAAVWLAIGGVGMALDGPRRGRWGRATATVAGAYLLNTVLKLVVRRRRPDVDGLPPLTGTPTPLTFPSAHATTSFTAAAVFAPLVPGGPRPLLALASAMAVSRLYLGVHWPSDVLAGAVLGTAGGRALR